jgi:hypothetical protein
VLGVDAAGAGAGAAAGGVRVAGRAGAARRAVRLGRERGARRMTPIRSISFGAGKQSTALLLMALEGSIDADCAIFADTQDEPVAVYRHLWQMAERCATAGFPLYVTTAGRLSDEVAKPGTFISVPVFGRNQQGEDAQLRRQCSYQFKLRPMRAFMKRRLAPGQTLEFLIGISTDEIGRAKPSGRKWVTNLYPLLIDKRMSRYDCVRYCAERGVYPPRSACVFCPFRTDDEWRDLTADEFEAACQFDDALRVSGGHGGRYGEELFVHDSMVPLRLVDFATVEDRGQGALFARGDCMGLCGV